ncbi:hypothetical protein [Clostridioides difficile]|uniref:hypothetical protein n=1 Tax=Clostridioides difficile TaxID=1496 RepID=UPI00374F1682
MYLVFKHKGILPSEYKKIKFGEKKIIYNMIQKEIKEKNEVLEKITNRGGI